MSKINKSFAAQIFPNNFHYAPLSLGEALR
jgi:hypothetical protein